MKLMEIGALQSDQLIKALCNTLLHSLWQGVILAVIAGLIVVFTKKASAAMRYNLLVGALALFAIGTAATFIYELQKPAGNGSQQFAYAMDSNALKETSSENQVYIAPPVVSPAISSKPAAGAVQQPVKEDITRAVISYLNTHYNVIVLIWFLIICAKSIQMAVGLQGVYHLKRTKVYAVGKTWENKVLQLADRLHIRQSVCLLESGLAKVPIVIGHLKPVILIPIGLINSLSVDEVEAILVHELAHIRRRDYLVNFLQSFMEIIFFFNPAVLWLSQLIRAERENCCDDMAVAQTGSRFSYMNALVNCHEYQGQAPAYGLAFAGEKGNLLSRIKRMVNNRNQSLNMFEKTVLAICLVALGLGASAFTAREGIRKAVKSIAAVIHHEAAAPPWKTAENDTIKKRQPAPANDLNGLVNQMQQNRPDTSKATGSPALDALVHNVDSLKRGNNQVPGLSGNLPGFKAGFGAPDTSWKTRNKAATKLFHDIGMALYREHLLTDTTHMNISLDERELIVNGVRMPEDVHARIYAQFGNKRGTDNYRDPYSYRYNYVPSDGPEPTGVIVPDFGDTLVKYGVIKDKRHIHAIFNSHGLIINGVKQPDDVFQMLFKKYGENTNITYTNNGLPDKHMEDQAYWAAQQRKVIDQMQREGLINDRNEVSFTLTTKTFVINGVVQNDEVFERYRREYVPADAGDNWNWNYHNTPGDYSAYANRYGNSGARYQMAAQERQRVEAERDKKLVADLLQDGLITDPDNVTFSLSNKGLKINGKQQSDEIYQKYKEKYVPNDSGDWSWTYSHHK